MRKQYKFWGKEVTRKLPVLLLLLLLLLIILQVPNGMVNRSRAALIAKNDVNRSCGQTPQVLVCRFLYGLPTSTNDGTNDDPHLHAGGQVDCNNKGLHHPPTTSTPTAMSAKNHHYQDDDTKQSVDLKIEIHPFVTANCPKPQPIAHCSPKSPWTCSKHHAAP
jgi:hypothetical protein